MIQVENFEHGPLASALPEALKSTGLHAVLLLNGQSGGQLLHAGWTEVGKSELKNEVWVKTESANWPDYSGGLASTDCSIMTFHHPIRVESFKSIVLSEKDIPSEPIPAGQVQITWLIAKDGSSAPWNRTAASPQGLILNDISSPVEIASEASSAWAVGSMGDVEKNVLRIVGNHVSDNRRKRRKGSRSSGTATVRGSRG